MKKLSIEKAAKRWIELKTLQKETEKEFSELKPLLEEALKEEEEKALELNGWKFSLVEFEKENFSLSKAKEKIDGRTLAPFISTSNVVQIRTSWQGGDEKEAA